MGKVRTGIPCRVACGVCEQEVLRYFSTYYVCILQALNWVRPCAWVRLPSCLSSGEEPVAVAASDGPSSCLKSRQWGPGKGFLSGKCGCGSLTGRQTPELSRSSLAFSQSWGLPLASRGIAWHDPDDKPDFHARQGAATGCLGTPI